MNSRLSRQAVLFCVIFSFLSTAASAQWVAVGRKVVGRISTLTQGQNSQNSGYDVATVFLNAEAGKVYSTTVSLLQKNPKMKITRKDDTQRTIEFTDGEHAAGLRITEMGDHLSQLLIASAGGPGAPSSTSIVVDAVKRVCEQLGVKYTIDPQ